jgi:prepilin-type N-terminal cleavage/methylation domain-containing protein/prepilin-type processing-associated H-X9-DG protein
VEPSTTHKKVIDMKNFPLSKRVQTGFTLIELLVVIAIIALLAAILFPVFASAREKARQSTCASNERQIGLGLMQYIQDNDETFPYTYYVSATNTWYGNYATEIYPYVTSEDIFICPDQKTGDSYANFKVPGISKSYPNQYVPSAWVLWDVVPGTFQPVTTAMIGDTSGTYFLAEMNHGVAGGNNVSAMSTVNRSNPATQRVGYPHSMGTNFVYCDGHTKYLSANIALVSSQAAWQPWGYNDVSGVSVRIPYGGS